MTLGKCTRENKCTHGRFTCFISGEMFENEETYHSQFSVGCSQICTRNHSKFSKYSKLQNITKKNTIEILILTLFTAFTTDRKFPMGEVARAGNVTDEETEISK